MEVEPFVLNHPDEIGVYLRAQKGLTIFGRMLTRRHRSGECTSSDVSRNLDSNTRMQLECEVEFDVNCDAARASTWN